MAILDHAGSVEQAVEFLASYNIDMGSVPLDYLIASAAGDAALVEFYQGEMFVLRNENPWQLATNFLLAASAGQPQGQCPPYDRLSRRLEAREGQLTTQEAFNLLEEVSQGGAQSQATTQWSVVYDLTGGEVSVIMGQKFGEKAHSLRLSIAENK